MASDQTHQAAGQVLRDGGRGGTTVAASSPTSSVGTDHMKKLPHRQRVYWHKASMQILQHGPGCGLRPRVAMVSQPLWDLLFSAAQRSGPPCPAQPPAARRRGCPARHERAARRQRRRDRTPIVTTTAVDRVAENVDERKNCWSMLRRSSEGCWSPCPSTATRNVPCPARRRVSPRAGRLHLSRDSFPRTWARR